MVDSKRVRIIKEGPPGDGPVIYLMSRDQRVDDNWALLYAQELATEQKQPLMVACPIAADYPKAPDRQIEFALRGLSQVARKLAELKIPVMAAMTPSVSTYRSVVKNAGVIVTDFNPLRESRRWKADVAEMVNVPFYEVDAHNIVPCRETSEKQEWAAYTIRPKITKKLNEFLTPFPRMVKHPFTLGADNRPKGWSRIEDLTEELGLTNSVSAFEPGETAAVKQLRSFLSKRLAQYNDFRNDPNEPGQSNLSPYLHFGQLSAQRVALEAQRHDADIPSQESFLEELIVRRELSDNFCYYNEAYDSFAGFPQWARKTLNEHRTDPRPYLYDLKTLESAVTHDELWNAAQSEMVVTGKMHGYMRMYWAKKILEWSASPEEAMEYAIQLNNEYELDGHDPNGYAGVAWSIGGVHDRAWAEREIFGKIRYMSSGGCRRKFSVENYVNRIADLSRVGVT